jgi:hypothetical protein
MNNLSLKSHGRDGMELEKDTNCRETFDAARICLPWVVAAAYYLALLSCVFCNNQILPWIF